MRVNKFSFLILTLVFCACSIFVSAKEDKLKVTNQLSIKEVPCQQKSNQLFQPSPIAQNNYDLSNTNSVPRINNGGSLLLGLAMPQPMLAFQVGEELDLLRPGTRGINWDWVCVAACVAWCAQYPNSYPCVTNCLNYCRKD